MSHCWITIPLLAQLLCAPDPHPGEPQSCLDAAYDHLPAAVQIGEIDSTQMRGKITDDELSYSKHRQILDRLVADHNSSAAPGDEVWLQFPVFFHEGPGKQTRASATAIICLRGMQAQNVCRNRNYYFFREFEIEADTRRIFANIVENAEWYRPCQIPWASRTPDPRKTNNGD